MRSSRTTRRQFLKKATASVTALAAFPTLIPASALGKEGSLPPSERITMGFIGVGGQGGGHLLGGAWTYVQGGYVGRNDVQVLAVCDVWKPRREDATNRTNEYYSNIYGKGSYKACEAYTDFREVLARPDIDAVLIATPIHWHAMMTVLAAEAGKDVYCEKPSALTVAESQAARAAILRHGRVFQAGTQQRSEYGGKFRQACELVRNGRIGQLKEVYACVDGGGFVWADRAPQPQPVPPELDWDLWLGPAPWEPYPGFTDAHRFGFGGINWGQHHYDIVQWGLDADRTGPVELFVDNGVAAYRYANGVVVYGRGYPNELIGSQGGVIFVGTEGRIAVDRDAIASYPASILRSPLGPGDQRLPRNTGHSNEFIECVRTRGKTICDVETAHRAASLMLLGGIVKELGRPLKWSPGKEEFLNDPEANGLLSVATRPPWTL
jgi:predicted dehydrogenase